MRKNARQYHKNTPRHVTIRLGVKAGQRWTVPSCSKWQALWSVKWKFNFPVQMNWGLRSSDFPGKYILAKLPNPLSRIAHLRERPDWIKPHTFSESACATVTTQKVQGARRDHTRKCVLNRNRIDGAPWANVTYNKAGQSSELWADLNFERHYHVGETHHFFPLNVSSSLKSPAPSGGAVKKEQLTLTWTLSWTAGESASASRASEFPRQ